MPDPFDQLREPLAPVRPRPAFARELRARIAAALGPDTGGTSMSPARPATATRVRSVQPYLTVHDGEAAIAWYVDVFGAVESGPRYAGSDGGIGHAELTIGDIVIFLSDEAPAYHAISPRTLGGTSVALHVYVDDVDAVTAAAERGGATVTRPPEDQGYGDRSATFLDPFGHKWMVATPLGERGVVPSPAPPAKTVWPALQYTDAPAAIRFLVDVVGFEERLVVAEGDVVHHAELVWPEGGGIMLGSAGHGSADEWSERPAGAGSVYVVTDDPDAVYERVRHAAGVEIIREPYEPDYDPGARGFDFRDAEGNLWSFGTYSGTPRATGEQ